MDELRTIYEDEVLLACDKPAGMLVHGDGTGARTLTDVVAAHLAAAGRSGVRPQPVHFTVWPQTLESARSSVSATLASSLCTCQP